LIGLKECRFFRPVDSGSPAADQFLRPLNSAERRPVSSKIFSTFTGLRLRQRPFLSLPKRETARDVLDILSDYALSSGFMNGKREDTKMAARKLNARPTGGPSYFFDGSQEG
jgi:hypothetical protein